MAEMSEERLGGVATDLPLSTECQALLWDTQPLLLRATCCLCMDFI